MRALIIGKDKMDTALVQLATEAEVDQLLAKPDVVIASELKQMTRRDLGAVFERSMTPKLFMELPDGRLVECGHVDNMSVEREQIDVTSFGDAYRVFAAGLMSITGNFKMRLAD